MSLFIFSHEIHESAEMMGVPESFCSFWMHPSSLYVFKVLNPVLTSPSLTAMLSDTTERLRVRWGFQEAAGPFHMRMRREKTERELPGISP